VVNGIEATGEVGEIGNNRDVLGPPGNIASPDALQPPFSQSATSTQRIIE
jgi:hypothetical protein